MSNTDDNDLILNKRVKSDKATSTKRTMIVYKDILKGKTTGEIVDKYTSEWGVKERQVHYYIQKARLKLDEISTRKQGDLFNTHVALRQELRNQAIEASDNRLALDILKDEAKLLNLYPEESINLKTPKDITIRYLNDWRAGETELESLPEPEDKSIVEGEVREIIEGVNDIHSE